MTVVYVCERRELTRGLGGHTRRRGIVSGLQSQGLIVQVVEVDRPQNRLPELLAFWKASLDSLKDGHTADGHRTSIYVEGLPLAMGIVRTIRRDNPSLYLHVDICDSWIQLSRMARTKNRVFSAAVRLLKGFLAKFVLGLVTPCVDSLSYISESDRDADAAFLRGKATELIVPNSADYQGSKPRPIRPNSGGPLCAIGDWSYLPNMRMLEETLVWFGTLDNRSKITLNLIGPGLEHFTPSVSNIVVKGWQEDLPAALDGCLAVISLVREGAGIKNKILTPLSWGLPVIALREGTNGIPASAGLVVADTLTADETILRVRGLIQDGFAPPRVPQWHDAVGALAIELRTKE